jgi:acyl-CoA thioesterase-1
MPTRRLLLSSALAMMAASARAAAPKPPVVTILGDSITAGLGLSAAEALPARLQAALAAIGAPMTVRGAGVSGDTTAGGLARVDFSVQPDTTICVVELGANDFLQSVDPKSIQANLIAIIRRLRGRGVRVVLAAGRAPAGSGAYGRQFEAAFKAAASEGGALLAPNLLEGVLDRPGFRQADGIHPNAAGVIIMARRLAPFVVRAGRPV